MVSSFGREGKKIKNYNVPWRVYEVFYSRKLNQECQNFTINKESTWAYSVDAVSDEAVDEYSKVNNTNTSNCEVSN